MKKLRFSAVMLTVLLAAVGFRPAYAQEANAAAQAAVESWLGLVDGQRYAESWQATATTSFFNSTPASSASRRQSKWSRWSAKPTAFGGWWATS